VIDHETISGNKDRPERTAYRGLCSCGWRAPSRRDSSAEALADLCERLGITIAGGVQTSWL